MAKVSKQRGKAVPEGKARKLKLVKKKTCPASDAAGDQANTATKPAKRAMKSNKSDVSKEVEESPKTSSNKPLVAEHLKRKKKKKKALARESAAKKPKRAAAPSPAKEEDESAEDSDADSFFAEGTEELPAAVEPESPPVRRAPAAQGEDAFKVFVGNIPVACKEDAVKQQFEGCGVIDRFDMPKAKEGSPRRHAFVYFQSESGALAALQLDGTDFHGMELQVKRAVAQTAKKEERQHKDALTVFVTGLGKDVQLKTLKKDFSECGPVEAVRMLKQPDGSFKGTAFVVFETEASVQKALAWNDDWYGENKIIVRRTGRSDSGDGAKGHGKGKDKGKDKGKGKGKDKGNDKNWNSDHDRTVFVGSLYPDATEEQLMEDFGECGELEKIRILKDKNTGFFKGAAFLVFRTQAGAAKALEWSGHDYYGRNVTVSKVQVNGSGKGKTGKGKRSPTDDD